MKKYIMLCCIAAISAHVSSQSAQKKELNKARPAGLHIIPDKDSASSGMIPISTWYTYKKDIDTNQTKEDAVIQMTIPVNPHIFIANNDIEYANCLMIDDHGISSEFNKSFTHVGIITDKITEDLASPEARKKLHYEAIRTARKTFDVIEKDTCEILVIEPLPYHGRKKIPEFMVVDNSVYFRGKRVELFVFLRE